LCLQHSAIRARQLPTQPRTQLVNPNGIDLLLDSQIPDFKMVVSSRNAGTHQHGNDESKGYTI
jgi:hypothetical protein